LKNGFFHERPNDYDIEVAEDMVSVVGARRINWHVCTPRFEGLQLVADVAWNGKTYVAVPFTWGADTGWRIVRVKS
jgi:hypothetical protein